MKLCSSDNQYITAIYQLTKISLFCNLTSVEVNCIAHYIKRFELLDSAVVYAIYIKSDLKAIKYIISLC